MNAADYFGYSAAGFSAVFMLPQLRLMYTKSTDGTSMLWLLWSLVTSVLWFVYGLLIASQAIVICNIISIAIHVAMVCLKIYRECSADEVTA